MSLIADALLLASVAAAAFYCRMLASRLKRFGETDKGLGGAISTLTLQVTEMQNALAAVSKDADTRAQELERLTKRADGAARRLELLLASLHDTDDGLAASGASKLVAKGKQALIRESNGLAASRQVSRLLARNVKSQSPGRTGS